MIRMYSPFKRLKTSLPMVFKYLNDYLYHQLCHKIIWIKGKNLYDMKKWVMQPKTLHLFFNLWASLTTTVSITHWILQNNICYISKSHVSTFYHTHVVSSLARTAVCYTIKRNWCWYSQMVTVSAEFDLYLVLCVRDFLWKHNSFEYIYKNTLSTWNIKYSHSN